MKQYNVDVSFRSTSTFSGTTESQGTAIYKAIFKAVTGLDFNPDDMETIRENNRERCKGEITNSAFFKFLNNLHNIDIISINVNGEYVADWKYQMARALDNDWGINVTL